MSDEPQPRALGAAHTHSHKRRLSDEQEWSLQALIRATLPPAHELPCVLWSKEAVRDLIHKEYGELLPERTLVSYIERWGFAPERPLATAHKMDPLHIRAWMRSDYPVIAFQSKEQKATICWLGGSVLRNMWSTDGNGKRIRAVNDHQILFVVSNRGNMVWKVCRSSPSMQETLAFLGKVISERKRKLFLIVPNTAMFKSDVCQQWVWKHQKQIELHLLPGKRSTPSEQMRRNGHGR